MWGVALCSSGEDHPPRPALGQPPVARAAGAEPPCRDPDALVLRLCPLKRHVMVCAAEINALCHPKTRACHFAGALRDSRALVLLWSHVPASPRQPSIFHSPSQNCPTCPDTLQEQPPPLGKANPISLPQHSPGRAQGRRLLCGCCRCAGTPRQRCSAAERERTPRSRL